MKKNQLTFSVFLLFIPYVFLPLAAMEPESLGKYEDLNDASKLFKVVRIPVSVTAAAFHPDCTKLAFAAASKKANLDIWDTEKNKVIKSLPVNEDGTINSIAYSPNGKKLVAVIQSCKKNDIINIWNTTETDEKPRSVSLKEVNSITFNIDDRLLACTCSNSISEFNIFSFYPKISIPREIRNVCAKLVAYKSSDCLFTVGENNIIEKYDLKNRKLENSIKGSNCGDHKCIAFNGKYLVAVTSSQKNNKEFHINIWDTETNHLENNIPISDDGEVCAIAYTRYNRYLAICREKD